MFFHTPIPDIDQIRQNIESYARSEKMNCLRERVQGAVEPPAPLPELLSLCTFFDSKDLFEDIGYEVSQEFPFETVLLFPRGGGGYGDHFFVFSRNIEKFTIRLVNIAKEHGHCFVECEPADIPMF